ncbi:MAG: hypothetical protein ABJP02_16530 [Parasphingorhabdus sp.]|uniref:hypothetical protein n=1 Tax=Parasphingorhabdus sp. TaxID=2709688 RepID=UPI00329820CD
MGDKGGDTAGSGPATISNDAMSDNGVSARMPAHVPPTTDDSDEPGSRDRFEPSSSAEKAQQLPGRMWVIAGAGLITWIVIAIAVVLFFF